MFGLRGGGRRGKKREKNDPRGAALVERRHHAHLLLKKHLVLRLGVGEEDLQRHGRVSPLGGPARGVRDALAAAAARARGTPAARMTMPKEPRPSSTPSLSVSLLIFQSFISRIFMPRHLALHPRTTGWTMASDDARARSAATLVRVRGSCGPYARRSTRVAGACCGRTGYLALQSTLRLCCPRLQG